MIPIVTKVLNVELHKFRNMKALNLIFILCILAIINNSYLCSKSYAQSNEIIYALNEGVTTKNVRKSSQIDWGHTKSYPEASYVKIKKKTDGTFYCQVVVGGQFAYGHYFKYQKELNNEYIYIRTDGNEEEYLIVNFPLSKLSESNFYDERVILKLINYRTSFGMLLKF